MLVLRGTSTLPELPVLEVDTGTVEVTLNESGVVELGGQQTLRSPVEGAVEEVLVRPGDRVQPGQVLITLRNPERQTALLSQAIAIQQQNVLLARQQQTVSEAAEQLAADEEQLQRLASLAEEGIVPLVEVQEQENQVRQSQAALRQAEANMLEQSLILENLQVEQQRIEQEVANTVITAPIGGIILGVDVIDGEGIERRTDLLTIGNPAEELVEIRLSTLNAAQVRPNQRARVTVIGPSSDVFLGRVVSLYPLAIAPEEDSESSQPIVPTVVQLDRPSRSLIPGSQVNVEIILEQRESVVVLDIAAIQRQGDRPFVWRLDEANQLQQQPITLGLEGLVSAEVTEGLSAGDRIVLPPPDIPLTPGMAILPSETGL